MNSILDTPDHRRRAGLLLGMALVSIALWQTHIGSLILYPFTILATWFHEMGHGIAAMLTGSEFQRLVLMSNGSGFAEIQHSDTPRRLTRAFIAASGPIGPALAGAALIVSSRNKQATRWALITLGSVLLLSTLIWVRSVTGWLILPPLGLIILAWVRYTKPSAQRFAVQFLGVQASISAWRQFDYLFTYAFYIDGRLLFSDTGNISMALFLPHWIWALLISGIIIGLMWWSISAAFRRKPL